MRVEYRGNGAVDRAEKNGLGNGGIGNARGTDVRMVVIKIKQNKTE
jgi:hypothetical protein